jgi:hypothetical protein
MGITLLASLAGTLILARYVEAQTVEDNYERLNNFEKTFNDRMKELKAIRDKLVPIGTILAYGGPIGHRQILKEKGWLFCDGGSLLRRDYPELYQSIKFAFGKPDDESFNLPDLRGRFVRGVARKDPEDPEVEKRDPDADQRTSSAIGGKSGRAVGSYQKDELFSHNHEVDEEEHKHTFFVYSNIGWGSVALRGSGGGNAKSDTSGVKTNIKIKETVGKETRPKNIYVNWIIKAK